MREIESDSAVRDRIDWIVREHPVVLFMKGTPAQPQCGFSAATVKVLQRYEVDIRTVDVLAELRRLADHPTALRRWRVRRRLGYCPRDARRE